jgi:LAO/AO transport system kinase
MEPEELKQRILKVQKEGRITCAQARSIAEETGAPYAEIGRLCDELDLKIKACELGCFD